MYRVNYGDGEFSQSFRDLGDAAAHLAGLIELPFAQVERYAGLGVWTVVS